MDVTIHSVVDCGPAASNLESPMKRPISVLAVLIGALFLAAIAYLAPAERPAVAEGTPQASGDAPWLPPGLVLGEPEMPPGVEGAMLELNRLLSAGVRPADNAAVLLVQVFGADVFEPELRIASLDMLGIRALAKSPRMQYVEAYVRATGADTDEEFARRATELNEALAATVDKVWTRQDHPAFAEFLAANADALNLVVTAADRPQYYAPLLSLETPMRLMSAAFSIEHRLPYIARCLTARALLRFGEGDATGGTADLVACQKLAVLLALGSPLDVSGAKAHIIDSLACRGELVAAVSAELSAEQASALLQAVLQAPRMPTADDAANRGERAVLHQELELLRTDEESRKGYFETGSPEDLEQLKRLVTTDEYWQEVLKAADAVQDKMVAALAIRPHAEQYARFAELDEEYARWQASDADSLATFAQLAQSDPVAAARSIGESMAMALRTNAYQRRHTDDRARLRRDAAILSLALRVYQTRHGALPESLAELTPDILPEVPLDAFSDAPFDYQRRSPDSAVIVSLGANQLNDAGSRYNDDLVIELK